MTGNGGSETLNDLFESATKCKATKGFLLKSAKDSPKCLQCRISKRELWVPQHLLGADTRHQVTKYQ